MPRHNALIFFSALDEIVCNISNFVFSGSCMRTHVVIVKCYLEYIFFFFGGGGQIIIRLILSTFKEKLSYVLSID